ncbi:MAG TPA: YceI family protein [Rubrivivax sp.]|nr:YceI family protein [Rubrivivax sp.]
MKPSLLRTTFAVVLGSAAQAQPAVYTIDPTHTFVSLEFVQGGLSTQRVRFDRKQGSVQFDRTARSGQVELSVPTDSLNSGIGAFDQRLKSSEFFDVAQHPAARFVSERFIFSGDRVVEVIGSLTLRGRTQPISFRALNFNCYTSPLFRREVCGGDFEATLQRSQWGLGALPAAAADDVRLLVQIEAIRQ